MNGVPVNGVPVNGVPVNLEQCTAEEKRRMLARAMHAHAQAPRHFPLSFAQQRLWFLDRLAPGSPFYNQYLNVRLQQPLDVAIVARAINEIVQRHDALRTTFDVVDGEPAQTVHPRLVIEVPVVDLSALPPESREAEAHRLATEEARRAFDLTTGPMVRVTLLRMADDEQIFLLTLHHIVSDGWSLSVFMREFETLCRSIAEGRASPLPPLRIQYPDYAVWQREQLRGEVLATQLAYWRERLHALPPLQLPADRPRPPVPTFRGGSVSRRLAPRLCDAIRVLSHEEATTPFMAMLTAFQVLLAHYTGQDDFAVGVPIANRTRAETEALIGFFVNTLVMRADLSGNPSFREALRRVKEVSVGAYAHQDLPFERLVEELQPERDTSRNPLYQVTFQLFKSESSDPADETGIGEPLHVDSGTALFDLGATVFEDDAGFTVQVEYSSDLLEPETCRRLLNGYVSILEAVTDDSTRPIRDVSVISAADRHQLMVTWNDTRVTYDTERDVPTLVAACGAAAPAAPAVVHGAECLTYAALHERSTRVAAYLVDHGVAPGDVVGVALPRSPSWIVATLAVWKVGAVYLPIDPSLPAPRRAWLEHDSDAAFVLSPEKMADAESSAAPPEAASSMSAPRAADRGAYVIYTSGSTGTPKGVTVTHRGLLNLVRWHQDQYRVTQSDHASQVASLSFDASVWEVWPYLAAGACVHIYDHDLIASPAALVDQLTRDRIDLCFLPTPLAERVLDLEWPAVVSLRALLTGGDVLHRALTRPVPFAVMNHYGPTECTVVATCAPVDPASAAASGAQRVPPIGRPIANTRAYIVDYEGRLAPPGAPGELCLAGDGLALGYRNSPDLTAQRFVPCAFEGVGARMYRTGDLARHGSDGQIEFLGRLDQQVKIRGFRIEPAEIEAALLGHAAVRDAAVVPQETADGERRLVAYVTVQPPTTAVDLRRHLQDLLPSYLVPTSVVVLDQLPLSASGKVDRGVLAALRAQEPQRATIVAPRTEMEQRIAHAWQEVLGLDVVGADDNFFDLGGHSLLLVKLQAVLQHSIGATVSIVDLFRYPTVAALARTMAPRTASAADPVHERAARQRERLQQMRAQPPASR